MKEVKEPEWTVIAPACKQWFVENIKGKLLIDRENLVEVYGGPQTPTRPMETSYSTWTRTDDTVKAYLIKSSIQPLEKDSLEKLVEDALKHGFFTVKMEKRAAALLKDSE